LLENRPGDEPQWQAITTDKKVTKQAAAELAGIREATREETRQSEAPDRIEAVAAQRHCR
jgi:hypothetical protein